MTKNEAIAEKVMRWSKSDRIPFWLDADGNTTLQTTSRYIGYWNPTADLNHAEKALVKYNPLDARIWRNSQSGQWHVMILGRNGYKDRATATNKYLSVAITDALLLATGMSEDEIKQLE